MVAASIGMGTREAVAQVPSSNRPSILTGLETRGTVRVGGGMAPPVSAM